MHHPLVGDCRAPHAEAFYPAHVATSGRRDIPILAHLDLLVKGEPDAADGSTLRINEIRRGNVQDAPEAAADKPVHA